MSSCVIYDVQTTLQAGSDIPYIPNFSLLCAFGKKESLSNHARNSMPSGRKLECVC